MQCRFNTTPAGTRWRHVCSVCGAIRETHSRTLVKQCPGTQNTRTPDQQSACLAICAKCEFWDVVRCKKCNCPKNDPTSWGKRLQSGDCPVGKWPSV